MTKCLILLLSAFLLPAPLALAQTPQPATRPMPKAEQLLDQMLKTSDSGAKPLQPLGDAPSIDRSTGSAAVATGAQQLHVKREGQYLWNKPGRLTRSGDGQQWEFTFDSDGKAMQDPPIIILPSLKLMMMEDAAKTNTSNRDLRFQISGMLTEYRGRNYILLEKVLVMPEAASPIK